MKNMDRIKDILQTILSLAIIAGISTALFLYTSGYRLQKSKDNTVDFTQTGMVNAKSVPDSASVYLDGNLLTATNNTISGVEPGKHNLKISKKGYVEWSKEIEVFPEFVTDITAVLVSLTPRLEPLTNTGARHPVISQSLTKLAYFSEDPTEPGIYIIPLSGINLSLFRASPNLAIKDTRVTKFSLGKTIEWSPDELNLLVLGTNDIYYLIDLQTGTAQTTGSPELLRTTWQNTIIKKRQDMMQRLEVSEEIKKLALSQDVDWAPDEKKFLLKQTNGNKIVYKVYNLEKPLPVGEKEENVVLELDASALQPNISWYPDSFHLVITEGTPERDNHGVISLIRIDGTNRTEIYSNTLLSKEVYSTRSGDKIIILTSFKSGNQTDLYTIGIH